MEPTLTDAKDRTYFHLAPIPAGIDWMKLTPWRAPGFAPVQSPCGLAAGWYTPGVRGNGAYIPAGSHLGQDGRDLPITHSTVWQAGSQQEVAFSLYANHGGGYAYRLCPLSDPDLTEECFQRQHLQFVGNTSWLQFVESPENRTEIPAVRISEGTYPQGSQWTRNPIPACSGVYGGAERKKGCDKPQFQPPTWSPGLEGVAGPGLYGFGMGRCNSSLPETQCGAEEYRFWQQRFDFEVVDLVQVPEDLPEGRYVLSFRHDAEETPQIWNSCADIEVVGAPRRALRGSSRPL